MKPSVFCDDECGAGAQVLSGGLRGSLCEGKSGLPCAQIQLGHHGLLQENVLKSKMQSKQ